MNPGCGTSVRRYVVAGHCFALEYPSFLDGRVRSVEALSPFESEEEGDPVFTLRIVCDAADISNPKARMFNSGPPYLWVFDMAPSRVFGFSVSPQAPDFVIFITEDCSEGTVFMPECGPQKRLEFMLANSCMLMYSMRTSSESTLVIHASAVLHNGRGYAFTGKSGSGKSTHSRLWLENIPGTSLLNDDNPVIRIRDGIAMIYGSPWSGKTPCYINAGAPLQAVVHIFQASSNSISALKGISAYASFIGSCSCLKWDRKIADGINATVGQMPGLCGFYRLECLPDRNAATLCQSAVSNLNTHIP